MFDIKVHQGWLRGEKLQTVQDDGYYYSFKGIPYAEPPVGNLRFKAPRPPLPWDGIKQATQHGPKCPQIDYFTQEYEDGREDCLYLNVYSPVLKPASPLPVMVYIHGGGYCSGSGNTDYLGPDFLVSHGVILVTINYRLDALGFLCLNTKEVPGNAGLKDQVAALRWVKENIDSFGGNSDNITIFGESAGGASVALHLLAPMSKGLFKRAISMSGVPLCDWSIAYQPQLRAHALGQQLGLYTNDSNELLDFLQKQPVEKLVNTNPVISSFEDHKWNTAKMYYFTPVVEKDFGHEHFLNEDPLKLLKDAPVNDVDILIGYTSEEALLLTENLETTFIPNYNKYLDMIVPRKLLIRLNSDQILVLSKKIWAHYFGAKALSGDNIKDLVKFFNDSTIGYDINRFISMLHKCQKSRQYVYKFSCVSNRNVYGNLGSKINIRGAAHMDDLMYLMDAKKYNLKIERNSKEYELIHLVCTVFTNFAKYGNPTPDSSLGVIWPEYDQGTKPYVDIGDFLTIGYDRDAECYQFWRGLYEELGFDY